MEPAALKRHLIEELHQGHLFPPDASAEGKRWGSFRASLRG